MLICICQCVGEEAVRRAIREGARNRREIGRLCDAGTVCGACHDLLERLLAEAAGATHPTEGTGPETTERHADAAATPDGPA